MSYKIFGIFEQRSQNGPRPCHDFDHDPEEMVKRSSDGSRHDSTVSITILRTIVSKTVSTIVGIIFSQKLWVILGKILRTIFELTFEYHRLTILWRSSNDIEQDLGRSILRSEQVEFSKLIHLNLRS